MRRCLSIFLVLLFGFGPLSSLIDGNEDANLPACCRRHGMHHCAIATQMAATAEQSSGNTPAISAPNTCPLYPGAVTLLSPQTLALATVSKTTGAFFSQEYVLLDAQSFPLSKPAQSHAGRGPPASNLA